MTLPNQPPSITSGDTALVAFYSFDETSGPIAHDQQGGHDGTIIGATYVPGETGNALQFNGSSDYVSVPDSSEWNLGSGDFTIEFWANFNSTPNAAGDLAIGQDEGAGARNKWFVELFTGSIGFHVNTDIGEYLFIAAPFEPTLGQWYSFDITRTGSSYQFYVDGQLVGSADEAIAIPDVAAPLSIGRAEGVYFDGQLDGVALYHRALSQAEVQQGYQDGAGTPAASATAAVSIGENATAVMTVTATDPDAGQTLSYSIAGGPDHTLFTINETTGALAFVNAPNYENPTDAGGNNVYDVTVQVSDGNGGFDTQAISVTVTNVAGVSLTSNAATITGTNEEDVLTGGSGSNTLIGGPGNDQLFGGDGKDNFIYAVGDGTDTIDGGSGKDTLNIKGTTANETIHVTVSAAGLILEGGTVTNVEETNLDLGAGTDTLSYTGTTSSVTVNLPNSIATGFSSISGVENVTGGSGNDRLIGNAASNVIDGGLGADTLTGGSGNDTFVFKTLANSQAAAFDTITDFTPGVDNFQIGHNVIDLSTGIVKSVGTGSLAADLASVLTMTNLKANGAAEVTIKSGTDAGTYVIINDNQPGYDANNDAVVMLSGKPLLLHTSDFIV
ncbi:LamG-like jellyroll fold domain-containing protein [Bradyrhizobium sp. UFLA05-109]